MSLLTKLLVLTAPAVRGQLNLNPVLPGYPCRLEEDGQYRLAHYDEDDEYVSTSPYVIIDFKFYPFFSDGGGYCKCFNENGMEVVTMGQWAFKCNDRDECSPAGNSQCTETPVDATCRDLDAVQLYDPDLSQQSWDYQYACDCPTGYDGNGYNRVPSCQDCTGCTNVDECNAPTAEYFSTCDLTVSECVDNDGSYDCNCLTGYEVNGPNTCGDVNECVDGNGDPTGDADVCADSSLEHLCGVCTNPGASAKCHNTDGSFECQCMPGYGGEQCQDLNECNGENGGHTCTSADQDADGFKREAQCANTPAGSFTCNCDHLTDFILATGSDGNSYCNDVNECLTAPCPKVGENGNEVDQVCVNQPGDHRCECPNGYELNNSGACVDIDECAAHVIYNNLYGCPANSVCEDTEGTYVCNCEPGFNMENGVCEDINECDLDNDCDDNAICTNIDGSYTCACARSNGANPVPAGGVSYQVFDGNGYTIASGGTGCTDIDECVLGTDHHNCFPPTECENNPNPTKNLLTGEWGGFNCICGPGTTQTVQLTIVNNNFVSLVDCEDDDECADKLHSCNTLTGSICTDVDYGTGSPGPDGQQLGYRCSCPPGFRFESCDIDGNNCDANGGELGDCVEINQCDRDTYPQGTHYAHLCNELAICNEDTATYYECLCPIPGTQHNFGSIPLGNGYEVQPACEDIDECLAITPGSWPRTQEYANHSYGGCPVDSVDCCPENSTCENKIITPTNLVRMQCNCNPGFTHEVVNISGANYNFCFDVLECSDANVCLQTSGDNLQLVCEEQQGSFACKCPSGTAGNVVSGDDDINTLQCANIDECSQVVNPCGTGFGIQCGDIEDITTITQYDGTSDGQGFFFTCSCKTGFQDGNEDCRDELGDDYPGPNQCGYSCVDIDECLGDHGCDENATCQNRTPDAQNGDTHLCGCNNGWTGGDQPNEVCTDYDECQDGLGNYLTRLYIGENLTCDDTSSVCQEVGEGLGAYCLCKNGYQYPRMVTPEDNVSHTFEKVTKQCFPVDECTGQILGQINPTNNQEEPTWSAFIHDDLIQNTCSEHSTCVNLTPSDSNEPGYKCECHDGFIEDANGICVNEDECQTWVDNGSQYPCDETKNCVDRTPGENGRPEGFDCECRSGYQPDPNDSEAECIPIDYCTETDELYKDDAYLACDGDENATCEGSIIDCVDEHHTTQTGSTTTRTMCSISATCTCYEGYHDPNTAADQARACEDILTCFSGEQNAFCDESNVDAFSHCEDGLGTNPNTCHCKPGYQLATDDRTCVDINECGDIDANIPETHDCNQFATCANTPVGSYTCTCDTHYTANGAGNGDGRGDEGCRDIDECALDTITTNGLRCMTSDILTAGPVTVTLNGVLTTLIDDNAAKCVNDKMHAGNNRSHFCECENGAEWSQELKSVTYETGNGPVDVQICSDIDECAVSSACPANAICHDLIGSDATSDDHTAMTNIGSPHQPYWCECKTGYQPEVDNQLQCVDYDECADNNGGCDVNATCINEICTKDEGCSLEEGRTCQCNTGWEGVGTVASPCTDVDECTVADDHELAHECDVESTTCHDTDGSYECHCNPGFEIIAGSTDTDRRLCQDFINCGVNDECEDSRTNCIDTPGSYRCECAVEGLTLNVTTGRTCDNVDECADVNTCDHNCANDHPTIENPTKFTCSCRTGFHLNADGVACDDNLECTVDGPHFEGCQENASCTEGTGSYTCACDEGYLPTSATAALNNKDLFCEDRLECDTPAQYCAENTTCDELVGSYTCTCIDAYSGQNEQGEDGNPLVGGTCYDLDECATDNDNCGVFTDCTNTEGSFECACIKGYEWIDVNDHTLGCKDIDECELGESAHRCRGTAECVNNDGGYDCECQSPGTTEVFDTDELTISCNDFNECEENAAFCHDYATCDNTVGSYDCNCNLGFEVDPDGEHVSTQFTGPVCINIDECVEMTHNCNENAICVDTIGSYTCVCNAGFNNVGTDKTSGHGPGGCENRDECTEGLKAAMSRSFRKNLARSGQDVCTENSSCVDYSHLDDISGVNAAGVSMGYGCICNAGFVDDAQDANGDLRADSCRNIDECNELNADGSSKNNCHEHAQCTDNTPTSAEPDNFYSCACKTGWQAGANDGIGCSDEDECTLGTDNCDAINATCKNTPGSWECTCNTGWKTVSGEATGTLCEDIDECLTGDNDCDVNADCHNNDGSYTCSCKAGWHSTSTVEGEVCADDDECADSTDNCSAYASCTNNDGSFTCECNDGYDGSGHKALDGSEAGCDNKDECTADPNICGAFSQCIDQTPHENLEGDLYTCPCLDGYHGDGKTSCENIFECDTGLGLPHGQHECSQFADCADSEGSYSCTCHVGYESSDEGRTCTDINECEKTDSHAHQCANHVAGKGGATCENILNGGGYTCNCDDGYYLDGTVCKDVDECADENLNECDREQGTCHNGIGSYTCTCDGAGWRLNSVDGHTCDDINECAELSHNCVNADCTDTDGSFECTCHAGYDGAPSCTGINECADGHVNQCETGEGGNGICTDATPGYTCTCATGYSNDWDATEWNAAPGVNDQLCTDIDECATGTHNCDDNASCSDTDGSYECSCNLGWTATESGTARGPNGCRNVDECTEVVEVSGIEMPIHQCHADATCTDDVGTYHCHCNPGFNDVTGNGRECEDVDECNLPEDHADHVACTYGNKCVNGHGTANCECLSGFRDVNGDGNTCEQIDECITKPDACHADAACTDTVGSWTCECNPGYHMMADGVTCEDDDECTLGTAFCSGDNVTCVNEPGSFRCDCDEGTTINTVFAGIQVVKIECIDIDECQGINYCSSHSICNNIVAGGYTCECKPGYRGNGWLTSQQTPEGVQGTACTDIDECFEEIDDCHSTLATCTNNSGGFECECCAGYSGTGHVAYDEFGVVTNEGCWDTDECAAAIAQNRRRRRDIEGAVAIPTDSCHSEATCDNIDGNLGGFTCACKNGFEGDGFTCEDVDECATNTHECDDNATCSDTHGGYECKCNDGWTGDGFDCEDIDECVTMTAPCLPNSECADTDGSYTCECNDGFEGDGIQGGCEDIDECTVDHGCNAVSTCRNLIPGHECECHVGYDYNADGVCDDVDECELGTDTCVDEPVGSCKNTTGSFECSCNVGYTGTGVDGDCHDKDECTLGEDDCPHECSNTTGSFDCSCRAGFEDVTSDGYNCRQIDECVEIETPCDPNAVCADTTGSYTCTCNSGFDTVDGPTQADKICSDIDECTDGSHLCSEHADCTNIDGSYNCMCHIGWHGTGKQCSDDDECALGMCSPDAECTNTDGSFVCACFTGFYDDGDYAGHVCEDVNECGSSDLNACVENSTCINGTGSYICECNAGWTGDALIECHDIDECADSANNECHANARCDNIDGGYNCFCNDGYEGDGKTCVNVDECRTNKHNCHVNADCEDTTGSFVCTCKPGYAGDGDNDEIDACENIDECDLAVDECSDNAVCTDSVGSYTCACWAGYRSTGTGAMEGRECTDIDECGENSHNCDGDNITCDNNPPGRFTCLCAEGFKTEETVNPVTGLVTGKICVDIDECARGFHRCDPNATCNDIDGGYECACNSGYRDVEDFTTTGFECENIDECTEQSHDCSQHATCADTAGSWDCTCNNGWTGTGQNCADIDECDAAFTGDACVDNALCADNDGSFDCVCSPGYRGASAYESENGVCENIDECFEPEDSDMSHRCHADASCTDTTGSYDCKCNDGYIGDGFSCRNIDECTEGGNDCHAQAECRDTIGSFDCVCKAGFHGTGQQCDNVDECASEGCVGDECGTNDCSSHAVCSDSYGDYSCACKTGWSGDGKTCANVDECENGNNNCDLTNGSCRDTTGSYECDCNDGFHMVNNICVDYKECDGENGGENCDANASCTELEGGFECNCNDGWEGDGTSCTDIDECVTGDNDCHATWATCTNIDESFTCDCNFGFTGDGVTCSDVDECGMTEDSDDAMANDCPADSACINNDGSYSCACNTGFEEIGDICEDINECDTFPCDEAATCTDTHGSYECDCKHGYSGDGWSCENIDECDTNIGGNDCHVTLGVCTDTTPGFECSCKTGYFGDGINCHDIDECIEPEDSSNRHNCDANASCDNTTGGFVCTCNSGWQGDGVACRNIDECTDATHIHMCGINSTCEDNDGGYDCSCDEGYEPTGIVPDDDSFPDLYHGCQNINECNADHGCNENATCEDLDFKVDGMTHNCECDNGFRGDGFGDEGCVNIDECAEGNHSCDWENAKCTDLTPNAESPAVFDCGCEDGWTYIKDFIMLGGGNYEFINECRNINECQLGTNECDHKCNDTDGSYTCDCRSGYRLTNDGKTCEDIDECVTENGGCAHTCLNHTDGSYECLCEDGFTLDGNGHTCTDINECETMRVKGLRTNMIIPCDKNAQCHNNDGSYTCECNAGFTGENGYTCQNINECEEPENSANRHQCHEHAECIDATGSYECHCNAGFTDVNGDGKVCEDIDECDPTNPCMEGGICTNTTGDFTCECPAGHLGDGSRTPCVDIDECDEGNFECEANEKCTNTVGDYNCEECASGFARNDVNECENIDECDTSPCSGDFQVCVDDVGYPEDCVGKECGYHCECIEGNFIHQQDSEKTVTCTDVNECDVNVCGVNSECTNNDGGFTCQCKNGYMDSGDDVTDANCKDINECETLTHDCDSRVNTHCENNIGSFVCACNTGYATQNDGECGDVNECATGEHDCCGDSVCKNNPGSFVCHCPTGFSGPGRNVEETVENECETGTACANIDECTVGVMRSIGRACEENENCLDNTGSYSCSCKNGFSRGEDGLCHDINECNGDAHGCGTGTHCINKVPSEANSWETHVCNCLAGYERVDEFTCIDIQECNLGSFTCGDNAVCVNLIGAPVATFGNNCQCNDGYSAENGACVNFNECNDAADNNCGVGTICIDKIPHVDQHPFVCDCKSGLKKKEASTTECENINECDTFDQTEAVDGCDLIAHSTCNDLIPHLNGNFDHFECECDFGFVKKTNSTSLVEFCEDVDECADDTRCNKPNEDCENLIGGPDLFRCHCEPGYKYNAENTACININECEEVEGTCPGAFTKCDDSPGSFQCSCIAGNFADNGEPQNEKVCSDINECDSENKCNVAHGLCNNTNGSFHCSCESGYTQNLDTADGAFACIDIKECEIANPCDAVHGECHEVEGGPAGCTCESGWRMVANNQCEQINECDSENPTHACNEHAVCDDTDGDYTCTCGAGFTTHHEGRDMDGAMGCVNIDECLAEVVRTTGHSCDENATCVDNTGSYDCSCNDGWSGDGHTCANVNECEDGTHTCDPNASCTDNDGSFECTCNADSGFVDGSEAGKCVHQCKTPSNSLGREDISIPGDFKFVNAVACEKNEVCKPSTDGSGVPECSCEHAPGFEIRNGKCLDINECMNPDNCDTTVAKCTNSKGNFACTCMNGYHHEMVDGACVNIDECNEGGQLGDYKSADMVQLWEAKTDPCLQYGAICEDRIPTKAVNARFACHCPPGHIWDRSGSIPQCVNKNECLENSNSCDSSAECQDTEGSYTCHCPPGWNQLPTDSSNPLDVQCEKLLCASNACPVDQECLIIDQSTGEHVCKCLDDEMAINDETNECETAPSIMDYASEFVILGEFVNNNYLKGFSRAGRKTRSKVTSFFNALQQQAGLYPPEGATDCVNIGFVEEWKEFNQFKNVIVPSIEGFDTRSEMQTKLINALNIWISAYFKDGADAPTGEATFFEAEDESSTDSEDSRSMAQRSSIGGSDSDSSTELTKAERKAAKKARKALKADLHSARVRRAGGRKKKKGGKKKGKRPGASASAAKSIDESCQMHQAMKNLVAAIANEIENACNGNRCHNDGK